MSGLRLLRTEKNGYLHFQEFMGESVPPYAILSHRWIDGQEITFEEMQDVSATRKVGYLKVVTFAQKAFFDGFEYCWIDTCCIDKRSCAELTEAINSMYKWYRNAQECYVYLHDVPTKHWTKSVWFTRGWTLQELIAPTHLVFYDSNWTRLGTKEDLKDQISRITGIRESVLSGLTPLLVPVSEKMSCASRRHTTRPEDMAYCLIGIFDVNIPLLYGEGSKAFKRLQEEIIRQSNTYTIFAWRTTNTSRVYYNALAPSPTCFDPSGAKFIFNSLEGPLSVGSRGVQVEVYLKKREPHEDLYEAVFNAKRNLMDSVPRFWCCIFLADLESLKKSGKSLRATILSDDLRNKSKMKIVFNNVSTTPPLLSSPELTQEIFIIRAEPQGFLAEAGAAISFSSRNYLAKPNSGKMIGLLYNLHPRWFIVVVGLTAFGSPWCQILIPNLLDQVVQAQEVYRAFSLENNAPLLATRKLEGIHAAVWLSRAILWPILCVSVEIGSARAKL